MNHDIDKLIHEIEGLRLDLNRIVGSDDWKELMKIIHMPGYTTPAEFYLVSRVVASMRAQTQVLANLQQTLLQGSHIIVGKAGEVNVGGVKSL